MANEVQVTEVVECQVPKDDVLGELKDAAIFFAAIAISPFALLLDDIGNGGDQYATQYVQQARSVDLRTIELVEDINPISCKGFRDAGAQTTLWDKQMRPIHVVQSSAIIQKFMPR